jgi:orotate phosphoribosyltransferase
MTDKVSTEIASKLLEINAIKLSPQKPFKWSSGWNSPIYCDNRLSLSYPNIRTFIKNALADKIKKEFPNVECIAGVASAGVPQGALVAEVLGLPFIYVRPKPKEHGMGNMIEGKITLNQKVVLVEDLISTGGSSIKAAEALHDANFSVLGMAAIFTYGFELADDNFKKSGFKLVCLSNYESLIKLVKERKIFSDTDIDSLNKWRLSPETWGNI